MYFPLVILLTLVVCLPASLAGVISVCMCAYLCAIAISQAIFQVRAVTYYHESYSIYSLYFTIIGHGAPLFLKFFGEATFSHCFPLKYDSSRIISVTTFKDAFELGLY